LPPSPICPAGGSTRCTSGARRRPSFSTWISSESPTYGEQEGSTYNGPLFVFNQLGDVERCALRPGNVHSADGWRAVLEPAITRYRGTAKRLYFRGDAAFANPEMYEFLEAAGIG
jgi:Transposase DDE domain group 1